MLLVKTISARLGLFTALLPAILMAKGCGYDSFGGGTGPDDSEVIANAPIESMRELYANGTIRIEEDIIIAGFVTANDYSGNFYKTFVIEDDTGAVEILAGFYDLHATYNEGRRVAIYTQGLCLGEYNGVMQLGRAVNSYSDYRIEPFGSAALMEEYVVRGKTYDKRRAEKRSIKELSESECGKLICVERVLFGRDTTVCWAHGEALQGKYTNGVHQFRDNSGDSLLVVTSSYCDFASLTVTCDTVNLTGILMYGKFNDHKPMFALKMRNRYDAEVCD